MRTNANNFLIRSFIFLTIVDDFSRFTWIFLMTNKSEARPLIYQLFSYIETQFSTKTECIRSDQGQEYKMLEVYADIGILHCIFHSPAKQCG